MFNLCVDLLDCIFLVFDLSDTCSGYLMLTTIELEFMER